MMYLDMSKAPKDRNILVKTITHGWSQRAAGFENTGFKWVEARWAADLGGQPRFIEWCGNPRTYSSSTLHPVAWAYLPSGIASAPS